MPDLDCTTTYKDIPGWPGYKAGDDGTIWSCWKIKKAKFKREMTKEWKQLKMSEQRNGHLTVTVFPGNKTVYVHRLVLEAFVGKRPKGMQCRHFPDRNPANNRWPENIRWGTAKENCQDRVVHKTQVCGQRCHTSKLTPTIVAEIRTTYTGARGEYERMARVYGIAANNISGIVNGKTWKHLLPTPPSRPAGSDLHPAILECPLDG